ncbi:MAG: Membrane-bound lytic murein transglycosylase C [Burkholderiaceae bacterium]|nr:Membrane-bound lytic murein transglycosylase C [Burkholderiaceae bacterium]
MKSPGKLTAIYRACIDSAGTFARDVGVGLLEASHNTLALLGLAVVCGAVLMSAAHPELRDDAEQRALGWLLARQEARLANESIPEPPIPDAVARVTAADPTTLSKQQASVAAWLARRYRVAIEPMSRLVQEAWESGRRSGLEPTLILAVMAIESSFNPFAQSSVGAQGLMQVMTRVHDDKYEPYGGVRAAFDPVTNLRVGVQVLKECIARAGSLEAGLKYYVGAANLADDGGYAGKVLAEQSNLNRVAAGKWVSVTVSLPGNTASPIKTSSTPDEGGAEAQPTSADTKRVAWVAPLR